MKEKMRIYVSGKITGLPLLQADMKFKCAEDAIRRAGHVPVNPMAIGAVVPGLDWKSYMTIAYGILQDPSIDAIYMLEDWKESKGSVIEWAWAQSRGIEVLYQDPRHYEEQKKERE